MRNWITILSGCVLGTCLTWSSERLDPDSFIFTVEDGMVVLEAEDAHFVHHYKEVEHQGAKAMEAIPKPVSNWGTPVLRFFVDFPTTGKYYAWMRGHRGLDKNGKEGHGRDEINAWLNRDLSKGLLTGFSQRLHPMNGLSSGDHECHPWSQEGNGIPKGEWHCGSQFQLQNNTSNWNWTTKWGYHGGNPLYWNVEAAGRHHIELVVEEFHNDGGFGMRVDKVVLTKNKDWKPSGSGPQGSTLKALKPTTLLPSPHSPRLKAIYAKLKQFDLLGRDWGSISAEQ